MKRAECRLLRSRESRFLPPPRSQEKKIPKKNGMARPAPSRTKPLGGGKHSSSRKITASSKAAAAAVSGYAKRHANKDKAKGTGSSVQNVYEYVTEEQENGNGKAKLKGKGRDKPHKRSKILLELDRDEEMGAGASLGADDDEDGGGGGEEGGFRMKARLIGEHIQDEKIDSEDDEEIDSDAAFDEDDDDRFAGFFTKKVPQKSKKHKSGSVRFADVDLDEDEDGGQPPANQGADESENDEAEEEEEEEESGEDDEFIDVLDILDGRGEPSNSNDDDDDDGRHKTPQNLENSSVEEDLGVDAAAAPAAPARDEDEDESESEDEEDESGEANEANNGDNISISLSEAENEATGALDDLQTFISSLDPSSSSSVKKRKATADDGQDGGGDQPKKRRTINKIKERTEAGVENEFRTRSTGLSFSDLLSPLNQNQSQSSALSKTIKALQPSSSSSGPSENQHRNASRPLPQRTQDRLDRQAAYEETKKEVEDKWSATMKRIKEAEFLSFPLQPQSSGGGERGWRVSNLELVSRFKPTTALESTISSLLTSANLSTETSVLNTENTLLENTLSVEEVAERRKELRKMRELLFRAEVKARRVKKIKSKVYRRLRRKEREGVDVDDDDVEGDGGMSEKKRLRMEMERARERATLKHKNTGKWAKKIMGRNRYDEDGDDGGDDDMRGGRGEIEEMLMRGEKLRRKIQGRGSDDDDDGSSGDDESADEGDVTNSAFNELRALVAEPDASAETLGQKGKSVFEMKFMKDAMARKETETERMVDDFVKEMNEDLAAETSDADGDGEPSNDNGVLVSRTGGRMVFRPGKGKSIVRDIQTQSVASEDTSSSTLKSIDTDTISPSSPVVHSAAQQSSSSFAAVMAENPWLAPSSTTSGTGKTSRKKNEVVVDKDSTMTAKSKHKLKKQAKKTEEEKGRIKEDGVVEIEMDDVLVAPLDGDMVTSINQKSNKGKAKGKGKIPAPSGSDSNDSDSNGESEMEAQENMVQTKGKQSKTVKAFEQRELVARAFAGDDVIRDFEEAKKREIAMDAPTEVDTTLPGWGSWGGSGVRKTAPKLHFIKKVAGIDPKSRADYNKSHVIISEKRDKKAAKYLVNDLPYPYTSTAQFDRRMQQPLGPEWNTRVGFQRGTLPKVVKKMGTVIEPLEKLS
ncbi:hypothetical protein D9757_004426 [Collybiopsis confluens]|uniref:Utp14-domain-containing protein n=1 Tax=Collybiopsis confluens TaxID=2823264 RepID=A0A8H5HWD4_9AGAR|nr:hypothetical protein D9757_004426 [Collybiopsis confluens]